MSEQQLGTPVAAEVAKELQGVWLEEGGEPLWVRYVGENELRAAGVVWVKEESKFDIDEFRVYVTEDEGVRYINLGGVNEDDEGYYIARCGELKDESLTLIPAKPETFVAAVEGGVLPGRVSADINGKSPTLEATAEQLNAFVTPEKADEQFDPEDAFVMKRVQQVQEEETVE
jgi:hypothetical protein